jgi:hypothetical protein
MKIFLTIMLGIALIFPLYSQEAENKTGESIAEHSIENEAADGENIEESPELEPAKKKTDFTRQYFEFGFDAGAGFNNGLVGTGDVLKKNIVVDMSKLAKSISEDGVSFDVNPNADFFINVKNITIGKGLWDFGISSNVDGGINVNVSKSLFTLISKGNIDQHDSSGKISVSGGIFADISLKGSAKYEIAGKPLKAGVKMSIFTPDVYIPSNSGVSYYLTSKKDGDEGIYVHTKGEIKVYTPTSLENPDAGQFIIGPSGFDISLEGEYPLFDFLDVGGSLTNIPFAAATLTNLMSLSMTEFNIALSGEDLIAGKEPEIPEIDFGKSYNNSVSFKVHRLFRFDIYARYKPFNSEFLVIRPNIGFSANVNGGDEKGYFNIGLETRLNLINMFTFYIGTGYLENIWKHKAGFNLNFRAFELDLEAALRDQTFDGAFEGHGFNINLGLRFGW